LRHICPLLGIRPSDLHFFGFRTQFFYRINLASNTQLGRLMSPSDRMAQLYPQVPDSLSVAFYNSQGGRVVFWSASTRRVVKLGL
jgi:hypothetical protein